MVPSVCLLELDFKLIVSRCHGGYARIVSQGYCRSYQRCSLGHTESSVDLLDSCPTHQFSIRTCPSQFECDPRGFYSVDCSVECMVPTRGTWKGEGGNGEEERRKRITKRNLAPIHPLYFSCFPILDVCDTERFFQINIRRHNMLSLV